MISGTALWFQNICYTLSGNCYFLFLNFLAKFISWFVYSWVSTKLLLLSLIWIKNTKVVVYQSNSFQLYAKSHTLIKMNAESIYQYIINSLRLAVFHITLCIISVLTTVVLTNVYSLAKTAIYFKRWSCFSHAFQLINYPKARRNV